MKKWVKNHQKRGFGEKVAHFVSNMGSSSDDSTTGIILYVSKMFLSTREEVCEHFHTG